MSTPTEPDDRTEQAERSEAKRAHNADRPGSPEEDQAADDAIAGLSDEDRERVRANEKEMAERGVHQQGEGRIE